VNEDGGPLDGNKLSYAFRLRVERVNLPYQCRFHDLRHTAATWLLRSGMPKPLVARMLGHSSDAITSIYEHLDFDDVQAAYGRVRPMHSLREAELESRRDTKRSEESGTNDD
jgi:integrase